MKSEYRIEALHLVALQIDARNSEGTRRHAKAVALLEDAKKLWRQQNIKGRCPHCGRKKL